MSPHPTTGVSRRAVARAATAVGLTAMFGAGTATAGAAAARAVPRTGPRTLDVSVASAALGRSAPLRLILPSDFDARPDRSYPVLYLLHGAHDDYTSWTRETDIESFTAGRELIVAIPDAGPTGIPTHWRSGPDYETFQVEEVPALLARSYRASGVRAVAGVSTGGYGAMAHAARHPGRYAAAASYSGILDTTAPGVPPIVDAIVARENLLPRAVGQSAAQPPHLARLQPARPGGRAARHEPVRVQRQRGRGRQRRLAARGAGERPVAVRPRLHRHARAARHPGHHPYYAGGGHSWTYWKREFTASWPMLARALGVPE